MHLFTYGTLMFAEVWRQVVWRPFPSRRATLAGYAVYRVRDRVFPGMVRTGQADVVSGLIYSDLDEEAIWRLDDYESDFYERLAVEATTDDGTRLVCQAYIVPDSKREVLAEAPWDADWFEQHDLASYLQR